MVTVSLAALRNYPHASDVTLTGARTVTMAGSSWSFSALSGGMIIDGTTGAVGIGAPAASNAILSLTSTTKGFQAPVMTQAQRLALTPSEGLIVVQSDGAYGAYQYLSGLWFPMAVNDDKAAVTANGTIGLVVRHPTTNYRLRMDFAVTTGTLTVGAAVPGQEYTVNFFNNTTAPTGLTPSANFVDQHTTALPLVEVLPGTSRVMKFVFDGTNMNLTYDSWWGTLQPTAEFTADFTALIGRANLVDNSAGLARILVTPPPSPRAGDRYSVHDSRSVAASGTTFQTRVVHSAANGRLNGTTNNLNLNSNKESVEFVYSGDPAIGWINHKYTA